MSDFILHGVLSDKTITEGFSTLGEAVSRAADWHQYPCHADGDPNNVDDYAQETGVTDAFGQEILAEEELYIRAFYVLDARESSERH